MNTRTRFVPAAAVVALFFVAGNAAAKPNPHAALDCGYCHSDTPRFGVDTVDTVNFWRAEGDEPHLCERCHGPEANFHPLGVTPGPTHLGTRPPAHLPLGKSEAVRDQVVCVTCHFVHAANADWALLRGFPGSDESQPLRQLAGPVPRVPRRRPREALTARRGRSLLRLLPLDKAAARPAGDGHTGGAQALRVLPRPEEREALCRHQPLHGAPGLHGMPRPASRQGPSRAPQSRLFRPDPRHGHAQPPSQAHALLRVPRRRQVRPPARRRRGRPLPALSRLRRNPGDEPPDEQGPRRLHDSPGVAARRRDADLPDLPRSRARTRRRKRSSRRAGRCAVPVARRRDGQSRRRLLPVPCEGPVGWAKPPPGGGSQEVGVCILPRQPAGLG